MNTTMPKQEFRNETGRSERTRGAAYTPRVDILEAADELVLFADLPGVKPEDLDIHFENGELTVYGRCPPRQGQGEFLLQEYGVGDYARAFSISEQIDSQKITAELKHGVLTVHLPKSEAVKPRR